MKHTASQSKKLKASHANDGKGGGVDLIGTTGADRMVGTAGDDTMDGGGGDDRLLGGAGADLLRGAAGADTLNGGAGDDTLDGGAANDLLFGGAGADTFLFGPGSGHDTARVDDADIIIIDAGAGSVTFERTEDGLQRAVIVDAWGEVIGSVVLIGPLPAELTILNGAGGSRATLSVRAEGEGPLSISVLEDYARVDAHLTGSNASVSGILTVQASPIW